MEELSEFYKAYGESLATRLRAIEHLPAWPTFVFAEERGDPAEVLAFLAAGKAPDGRSLLIWENFEEDIDSGGRDNYHSVLVGSVAVIRKALTRPASRAAYATSRMAALQALSLMIQDAQDGPLYQEGIQVEVRRIPCEKIKALSSSWYGYAFEFTWHVPLDLNLPDDALIG